MEEPMRPAPRTQTGCFIMFLRASGLFPFGRTRSEGISSPNVMKYAPPGTCRKLSGGRGMRNKEPDDCGFAAALRAIGGKWKTSLLWALHLRPHRFAELRRLSSGISEKVLTQQLRQMEADGLISRHDYDEV